jgi:hypothetical protein
LHERLFWIFVSHCLLVNHLLVVTIETPPPKTTVHPSSCITWCFCTYR